MARKDDERCFVVYEALYRGIRKWVVCVVAQEARHEEVEAGAAGEGVGVTHGERSVGDGLRNSLEVNRSVFVHDLFLFVLLEQDSGHVANRALAHDLAGAAARLKELHEEHGGGAVAGGGRLAGGDVVHRQAAAHRAELDARRLAAHLGARLVELLGHLAHPAVRALAGLLGGGPHLGVGVGRGAHHKLLVL